MLDLQISSHQARALIDTGTIKSNLISNRYDHSYKIPSSNYKTQVSLGLAVRWFQESIIAWTRAALTNPTTQFKQIRRFEVYSVDKYDFILGMSFLTENKSPVHMATDSIYLETTKETWNVSLNSASNDSPQHQLLNKKNSVTNGNHIFCLSFLSFFLKNHQIPCHFCALSTTVFDSLAQTRP